MTTSMSCADEVALSADVVDLIAERAAGSDVSGHLDPDVAAALRTTGINRLLLPVELGGLAASPRRCVDVVERIAAADGSTAWAAAIGFGTNLFAGYVDRDGAAELFGDPDQPNAAMFAPMAAVSEAADGTLRLTGRWPFTSNCEQAAWLGLAAAFPGEPAPRLVFAPRAAVTIHQTWDVAGLRATASNDTSLTDFVVDRRHTCSFADPSWAEGTLWRLPLFVALAPPLAAVGLGVARGTLDEINRQALARVEQCAGRSSTITSAWATSAPPTRCCAAPAPGSSRRSTSAGRGPRPAIRSTGASRPGIPVLAALPGRGRRGHRNVPPPRRGRRRLPLEPAAPRCP